MGSEATVKQSSGRQARWRVTEMEPGRSFTWESKAGLVTIIGVHAVAPDGEGSVITLTLDLRGPLSGVVGALTGRSTVKNITMEMEGFRRTAESEPA